MFAPTLLLRTKPKCVAAWSDYMVDNSRGLRLLTGLFSLDMQLFSSRGNLKRPAATQLEEGGVMKVPSHERSLVKVDD